MKRRKLHRVLAVAFLEIMPRTSLTLARVKRYATSDLLSLHCIRRSTKITDVDRMRDIEIAINAIKCKPEFRGAPRRSPSYEDRKEIILSGLADPR